MRRTESDVPLDSHLASSRVAGGRDPEPIDEQVEPDATSTTGVNRTEEFVGRVAGDDLGYAGETGAEARADAAAEAGTDR